MPSLDGTRYPRGKPYPEGSIGSTRRDYLASGSPESIEFYGPVERGGEVALAPPTEGDPGDPDGSLEYVRNRFEKKEDKITARPPRVSVGEICPFPGYSEGHTDVCAQVPAPKSPEAVLSSTPGTRLRGEIQ